MTDESINGFYRGGAFPRGHVWSRFELLGSTDEEMTAMKRGELPIERAQEIQAALIMATRSLEAIVPLGRA